MPDPNSFLMGIWPVSFTLAFWEAARKLCLLYTGLGVLSVFANPCEMVESNLVHIY